MVKKYMKSEKNIIETEKLSLWYGTKQALIDIDISCKKNKVTALIGPSGCGKSTLIRCFNRMNDVIVGCKVKGKVVFNNENIYGNNVDVDMIRKK